jgi:hypothetical protein
VVKLWGQEWATLAVELTDQSQIWRSLIGSGGITRRWAVEVEGSRDSRMVRHGVLVTVWTGYEMALAYLRLDQ